MVTNNTDETSLTCCIAAVTSAWFLSSAASNDLPRNHVSSNHRSRSRAARSVTTGLAELLLPAPPPVAPPPVAPPPVAPLPPCCGYLNTLPAPAAADCGRCGNPFFVFVLSCFLDPAAGTAVLGRCAAAEPPLPRLLLDSTTTFSFSRC